MIGQGKVTDGFLYSLLKLVNYVILPGAVLYHGFKNCGPKQKVNQLGGKSLEATFCNGKLALSIDCPRDLFEINNGNPSETQRIIAELNKIFEAIDPMDIHTKHVG